MPRTIAELQTDLSRKLHGTNLNKLQGEFSLYAETARAVLNDIDFWENKRIAQIANAIYSDVYDYALPSDVKGNRIIDIRPQVKRGAGDFPNQRYGLEFDRRKDLQTFTIRDNSGVRTLRLNVSVGSPSVIHEMDSITDNGTWTVGGDATNLTLDTLNFVSGTGSLNFDTSGATTTAFIEVSDMAAVDLTDLEDQGAFFVWVYMPVAITDATLRWGDDTSNYWSDTVTTPQNGSFQVGWNLIRFDWNGATQTGTPTVSSINYLRVSITYDGNADTDYRVDNIIAQMGNIYEIEYYSEFLFRNSAGTFIAEPTTTTDDIMLESEGYNCFLYKCLELAAAQIQAEDASFDLQLYASKYIEAKERYQAKYKSEIRVPIQHYYRKTTRSRRGRGSSKRFTDNPRI